MGEYGKSLWTYICLNQRSLTQPIAKFQGKGENKVEKVTYEEGKVLYKQGSVF